MDTPADEFDYVRDALPARSRATPRVLDAYDVLRDRSLADRLLVREALRNDGHRYQDPRPDDETLPARCERAYTQYVTERGTTSGNGYATWWQDHPDPDFVPNPAQVRWHLGRGSWRTVADKYGRAVLDGSQVVAGDPAERRSAREITALGPIFEKPELEAPLRAYIAETEGWLSQTDFLERWCVEELAKPAPRFKRLPGSSAPFKRCFGSFRQALAAVGADHRHTIHKPRPRPRPRRDAGIPKHSPDDVHPFLAAAWDERGPSLGAGQYTQWVKAERIRRQSAGKRDPKVPGVKAVKAAYRAATFDEVLFEAGFISLTEALLRIQRGAVFTKRDLFVALADAMHNVHRDVGGSLYDQRRLSLCADAAEQGVLLRLPSSAHLRQQLGGGSLAAARAATREWIADTGYRPKDDPR